MNDKHFFELAREASLHADYTGSTPVKIGSVVVYKGSVLAKGWNSDKTHSEQEYFNQWREYNKYKTYSRRYLPSKVHAEIACLSKIKYLDIDFSHVHLYIYRELKNGRPALARPCPACMAAIRQLGIQNIHYTTNDGFAFEKIVRKL